jgi:hypothetical protein
LGQFAICSPSWRQAFVVHVSSTADIFIIDVGQAPWLPLVLAGFSILGILVGIWLPVRAFLLLGTPFLIVSLLTIIWYAAVDLHQTWLWWAMGIVTGSSPCSRCSRKSATTF